MKRLDYNAINWSDWVYYDESSPSCLRWKIKPAHRVHIGDVAGSLGNHGYSSTCLFYALYKNHRIIWILFNGEIDPELQIDHIDGDRGNNKIENLRLVTRTVNSRNSGVQCNNKTGSTGVNLHNDGKGRYYYTASWYTVDGKLNLKHFSILKLGQEDAFRLACEYRERMIKELNEQGAGYTERHGI